MLLFESKKFIFAISFQYTNLKNRIKRTYGFELEEGRFPIDIRGAGAVEIGGGALGRRLFSVGNVLEFGIRAAGGAVGGRGVVTDLAPRLAITNDPTSGVSWGS